MKHRARASLDHCYLIAWSARGPTKVGVAVDPVQRLGELQCGCPFRLRIYFAAAMLQPAIPFEQALLARFHERRLIGEWIDLGPRILQAAMIENLGKAEWAPWKPTKEQIDARLAALDRQPKPPTAKVIDWHTERRAAKMRRSAVEALSEWQWHHKQITGR